MEIKKSNFSKDVYEHHPEIEDEITKYEIVFLLKQVSEMELNSPDSPLYKGKSISSFLDSIMPENKEKTKFVSDLMEKYTLIGKTEDDEILKPSDLFYKEVDGIKELRTQEERDLLMKDLLTVAEEKYPLSTKYRHISYHDTQLTLDDRLGMEEDKIIDLELLSKSGAIMYDKMPPNHQSINDYKVDRDKTRRLAMGRS